MYMYEMAILDFVCIARRLLPAAFIAKKYKPTLPMTFQGFGNFNTETQMINDSLNNN